MADFKQFEINGVPFNSKDDVAREGLSDLIDIITQVKHAGAYVADGAAKKTLAIPFAKVDSTSTATAFTATVDGITELVDGTCVMLENGVVTSAAGFTININGLGAKPAFSNLTAATRDTTIFNVNYTMLFVYDSTRVVDSITGAWCCYRGYDANTNTIGYQLRSNSYSKPMTDVTYRYRLFFSSADNTKWVPANTSSSTNATASRNVCQTPINPFGEIVYYGTTASVAAGSRPSATNLWQQYTLSLGYSFNKTGAALTLTSWKPIYVKCAPQTNGSAIIDADTPYVQDLPSTEDGKIYIFLGVAYSATNIELLMNHPVFYYKDGAIRQWNNQYNPTLATVATTGSYDDLSNKPTIPDSLDDLADDSTHRLVTDTEKATWNNKATTAAVEAKYTKPSTGIPASDLASGVIPDISGKADKDEMSVLTSGDQTTITLKSGTLATVINSHQSLANYVQKSQTSGLLKNDGTIDTNTYLTSHQDITGKVDKVTNATNGHLAGLNANGNLTDSGIVPTTLVYQGANDGTVSTPSFDPETDTVHVTAQVLSSSQQIQARTNIGAGTSNFSGSYNDLTNKPTIPDTVSGVNDGTNWTSITIGNTTKAIPSGGGDANVIESVSINNTAQTVTSKNVDLPVPTSTSVYQILSISQADYDNLGTKSSTTLYLITS